MSLRSTGSWFPLPALVGVVVLFPLALLSHAATLASATAATRLSPFRALSVALLPLQLLRLCRASLSLQLLRLLLLLLGTLLLILFLILKFHIYLDFDGLLP